MKSVYEFTQQLLSYEEYSCSWDEIIGNVEKTPIGLKSEINRLIIKKELINLRKGFYLIPGPRYKKTGHLPAELYVDKLFKWLNRPYYVGLFSAARLHGAANQQIQQTYLITSLPALHPIRNSKFNIRFFSKNTLPFTSLIRMKSDAGTFSVSSTALTSFDLIRFQQNIGGLPRILSTLEALIPQIPFIEIKALISENHIKTVLQRLGFFLDYWQNVESANILFDHLKNLKITPVLLANGIGENNGKSFNRWNVMVNLNIEEEL